KSRASGTPTISPMPVWEAAPPITRAAISPRVATGRHPQADFGPREVRHLAFGADRNHELARIRFELMLVRQSTEVIAAGLVDGLRIRAWIHRHATHGANGLS